MTTIAFRDGWMVSESRATWKNRIDDDSSKKLYRLKDSIIGGAGDVCGILEMLKHLKKAAKEDKKLPNVAIKGVQILMAEGKRLFYYERGSWEDLDIPYYSIGTGSDYALAAMDAGASAVEAVKIACKRDVFSGGPIQKMKVT